MNCKHHIDVRWCGICSAAYVREQVPRAKAPTHHEPSPSTASQQPAVRKEELVDAGFLVIVPKRNHPSHLHLNSTVHTVHINGFPCKWLVELILAKTPNLRRIQMIPAMLHRMQTGALSACEKSGVEVASGYLRPEMMWEKGEVRRTAAYHAQHAFFQSLKGGQRALFDELLAFEFEIAEAAARYYQYGGHKEEVTQKLLANELGFVEHYLSGCLYGLMRYLDPTFEPGSQQAYRHARSFERKVKRLREYFRQHQEVEQVRRLVAHKLGIEELPHKLPLSRLDTFSEIIRAQQSGKLRVLSRTHSNVHQALVLRFGLGTVGVYRTLQAVGDIMFLTRERVRQLEEAALVHLGIDPD